jgi:hypothetical protein
MPDDSPSPSILPWYILPGLAALVLVIFAAALVASLFLKNETLQTQMFTGAYGLATMAVGYFFGSSAGSAKKDDAAAADSAKKTEGLVASAPAAVITTTTIDPGPPPTATTTTTPAKDPAIPEGAKP